MHPLIACVVEVGGHFGLAPDHDRFASAPFEIYTELPIPGSDGNAFVGDAVAVHSGTDSGHSQKPYGAQFKYTCPNAAEYVVSCASFQQNRVDSLQMQQLREQQTCWAAANDADLGTHAGSS